MEIPTLFWVCGVITALTWALRLSTLRPMAGFWLLFALCMLICLLPLDYPTVRAVAAFLRTPTETMREALSPTYRGIAAGVVFAPFAAAVVRASIILLAQFSRLRGAGLAARPFPALVLGGKMAALLCAAAVSLHGTWVLAEDTLARITAFAILTIPPTCMALAGLWRNDREARYRLVEDYIRRENGNTTSSDEDDRQHSEKPDELDE